MYMPIFVPARRSLSNQTCQAGPFSFGETPYGFTRTENVPGWQNQRVGVQSNYSVLPLPNPNKFSGFSEYGLRVPSSPGAMSIAGPGASITSFKGPMRGTQLSSGRTVYVSRPEPVVPGSQGPWRGPVSPRRLSHGPNRGASPLGGPRPSSLGFGGQSMVGWSLGTRDLAFRYAEPIFSSFDVKNLGRISELEAFNGVIKFAGLAGIGALDQNFVRRIIFDATNGRRKPISRAEFANVLRDVLIAASLQQRPAARGYF